MKTKYKYSDQVAIWLKKLGYTHCFFLSGGNIMHAQESFRTKFKCVPIVHEVAAGIATEYFNATSEKNKALALVTAGPGITNIITAIGGAYLESRELLVIGGQVKREDLSNSNLRQRGIQEIDGVKIAEPITNLSIRLDKTINFEKFKKLVEIPEGIRKGPIFIEIPLDIQGYPIPKIDRDTVKTKNKKIINNMKKYKSKSKLIVNLLNKSKRPSILIGAGVSRETAIRLQNILKKVGIPIMLTWNASDRMDSNSKNYFGRPNTWGQRYSNIIIQQSDMLLALGTRLGLQQSGFNWKEFVKNGDIIHVDIDRDELNKHHPKTKYKINLDANIILKEILNLEIYQKKDWIKYCNEIKEHFPLVEKNNHTSPGFISPYDFYFKISKIAKKNDVVIPCSSGGAFTTFNQTFEQKLGQKIINNKALASMGYGLSGAIGAAFANPKKRIIHFEGDGGFTQNLQEYGTVAINKLNIKTFLFCDDGYASIRMTQKNYFNGAYMGCDIKTKLGIPNWNALFKSWGIKIFNLKNGFLMNNKFLKLFNSIGPNVFVVPIDPLQTYFPKITSRVTKEGSMESNPLHNMSPEISGEDKKRYLKYIR
tara:strand:- start:7706 stop:9487 length:1782 start_codon:yes stop_codon:yes gene_type:complete